MVTKITGPTPAPTPPPLPPPDPNIATQQAKADADSMQALQTQARGDTASIMARYGTRLALAGTGGTPTVAAPAPAPAPVDTRIAAETFGTVGSYGTAALALFPNVFK